MGVASLDCVFGSAGAFTPSSSYSCNTALVVHVAPLDVYIPFDSQTFNAHLSRGMSRSRALARSSAANTLPMMCGLSACPATAPQTRCVVVRELGVLPSKSLLLYSSLL